MRNIKNIILGMALATMCGCNTDIKLTPGQAYFRSFTYTGEDPEFAEGTLSEGEIFNPILQGAYSDASICRKGNDYYMSTANFAFFPGVPILHSTDLVNWEQICYALPTDRQLVNTMLRSNQGLYASTIRYNKNDDTFYLTGTLVGGGGHFIIKAKDPAGPWSDPTWLYGLGGVHPSLFFDDNGKVYILNQGGPDYDAPYYDFKVIWCQEFDLNNMKGVGDRKIILAGGHDLEKKPSWLEAPHIYKKDGYYYLVASEGGSLGNGFSSNVFRAKDIFGTYKRYEQNPIVTQRRLPLVREGAVSCTGHIDMVDTESGQWYGVFQGVRPYSEANDYNQGREVFMLPVTWDEDGWPYLIRNGEPVPNKIKAPFNAKYAIDSVVFSKYIPHGNFTYVENFESDVLPMQWSCLRTPTESPIVPNGEVGLQLALDINNIRMTRHCGFVGIRQMHKNFTANTEMHFLPQMESEYAGIALYLGDNNNYEMGVTLRNDKYVLVLQKAEKGENSITKEIIESKVLNESFVGRVFLCVKCTTNGITFSYKFDRESEYKILKEGVSSQYLSLSRGDHFNGVYVGLYTSQEEE